MAPKRGVPQKKRAPKPSKVIKLKFKHPEYLAKYQTLVSQLQSISTNPSVNSSPMIGPETADDSAVPALNSKTGTAKAVWRGGPLKKTANNTSNNTPAPDNEDGKPSGGGGRGGNWPLDKSDKKPRKWIKKFREIKSFTGFKCDVISWYGDITSDFSATNEPVKEEPVGANGDSNGEIVKSETPIVAA